MSRFGSRAETGDDDASTPDDAIVLRDLLDALAVPGNVDPDFAAYLSDRLRGVLRELEPPVRGSAFDGRLVATDGDALSGDDAHDPKL